MIKVIALLLLLQNAASGETYYLEMDHFLYPGVPNFPEYGVMDVFEGFLASYHDDNVKHINQDWLKEYVKKHPEDWKLSVQACLGYKDLFRTQTKNFNTWSNQSEGKEIIQQIIRCDWDEETDNTFGHVKYGNNGEDFITLDTKTETWFATNSKAEVIIDEWNADKTKYEIAKYILQNGCLPLLKVFVKYGKSYLSRKVLPSVFLLQKSPSSPVTCHATGFFPDKGIMFWRKDGEEIHEGVEHGDLLPNDDGSFQMSVYLEALKIPPEDWGRYECVFQLSGVQNYVVTKLDQDSIRSNNPKNEGLLTTTSIAVIATMGCVIVIIIVALSSTAFKKRNVTHSIERSSTPSSETASL
ncbi:major histocompatibility complex class I-related gene protein-like isoform X1 [Xiphophorus maculatus]|uniref:major histocompatibility complex class I-related gene protein-like isoform X1 n=1 Tax=Xiphophorus maculatus TaxID=8083 RepID=UPI000C6E2F54|nr:major histocompatibility complex class I-related gene protein-like isoform X1 [Xiphophorus maculatus]